MDLNDFRIDANVKKKIVRTHNAMLKDDYNELTDIYGELKHFYHQMDVRPGRFPFDDNVAMLKYLNGEATLDEVPEYARDFAQAVHEVQLLQNQKETQDFYHAALSNGAAKFLNGGTRQAVNMLGRIRSIGDWYITRRWDLPDDRAASGRGAPRRPTSTEQRGPETIQEMLDKNYEPAYRDPFVTLIMDMFERQRYRYNIAIAHALDQQGLMKRRHEAPSDWRQVPVGAPFEPTGKDDGWFVPNEIGDYLVRDESQPF